MREDILLILIAGGISPLLAWLYVRQNKVPASRAVSLARLRETFTLAEFAVFLGSSARRLAIALLCEAGQQGYISVVEVQYVQFRITLQKPLTHAPPDIKFLLQKLFGDKAPSLHSTVSLPSIVTVDELLKDSDSSLQRRGYTHSSSLRYAKWMTVVGAACLVLMIPVAFSGIFLEGYGLGTFAFQFFLIATGLTLLTLRPYMRPYTAKGTDLYRRLLKLQQTIGTEGNTKDLPYTWLFGKGYASLVSKDGSSWLSSDVGTAHQAFFRLTQHIHRTTHTAYYAGGGGGAFGSDSGGSGDGGSGGDGGGG